MRIFISYSHADSELAKGLVRELCPYHDCWIDREDIRAGSLWQESINAAVRDADCFLFVASWEAIESKHCQHEVELALRWRKKIVPLVLDDPIVMRSELAQLQWIFLDEKGDWIRSLLVALQPVQRPWRRVALIELALIILMTAWMIKQGMQH